jgi:hypothetical protein
MKLFIKDEKITVLSELILGGLVGLGFFGIPYFDMPVWLAIPVGIMSSIAAGILMFSGRASALGLKPFNNDPLGWRKAKQSYETDTKQHATSDEQEKKR